MSALAAVIMLIAYFPYLTVTVPALAGIAVMFVFVEAGAAYAVAAYIVSGTLALLLCEKEAAVLFVCLLGYYPILKAYIEKLKNRFFEWALKLLVLNAAAILSYYAASYVFDIGFEDFGTFGKWGGVIVLSLCNAAFAVYDLFLSSLAARYCKKYRARLVKIFSFLKK